MAASSSEFWYPPATAHAADVEGVLPTLGPWTLVRADNWSVVTPVADAVSGLSSPAAGTVRLSYNVKRSHISIQPALGLDVALIRTFPPGSRPTKCQFRVRAFLPTPQSVATFGDSVFTLVMAGDAGGPPDIAGSSASYVQLSLGPAAADTILWRHLHRNTGTFTQIVDSLNMDTTPHEGEMILAADGTTLTTWMRSGGALHKAGSGTHPECAPSVRHHLLVFIENNATANVAMPFAPVFHVDYLRQLDHVDIF